MMHLAMLLLAAAMPQGPGAAEEAKARADLGQAAQHVDELLLHAAQARDRAKAALALARSTEATASQVDRARLAKVAGDLAAQLASLDSALESHEQAIRVLRTAVAAEAPPPAPGSGPWFRERMRAARRLPGFDETIAALRTVESEVQAEVKKGTPGADALLGHVRYLYGEAIREAALEARSRSQDARAVSLLRDASKKLEEVLGSPDSSDTGEGSSLHAVALRRRVEIEAGLFLAFRALQQQQRSNDGSTAKRHRDNATRAFERLAKLHGEATLPDGQRVVDATRASVERMQEAR